MAATAGHGAGCPGHRHLTRQPGAAPHAEPEEQRPHRRRPVLRRPGRRRPAHDGARPHRRAATARTSPVALRPWGSCARASASPASRAMDKMSRARVRGPRQADRQRDRGLDRRHPGDGRRARPVPRPRLQGHPPRRAPRPHPLATGLILRTEKSVLFVIPWGRHWIIGTTDTDWDLDKAHPAATRADIDYLLDHVNRVLATPLTHEDVEGVYAGLRPLLAGESEQHVQAVPRARRDAPGARPGRRGRRQVHDLPGDGQGRRRRGGHGHGRHASPSSTTETIPLLGGVGYSAIWNQRQTLARSAGLHVARVEHLLKRYGSAHPGAPRPRRQERPELRRAARRAPRTTCAPRSPMPPPTRGHCTSTTCWRAVPASRSRSGTAGSPPPSRPPGSWRRSWAGTTTTVRREVEAYHERVRGRARVADHARRPLR